ncbi:MAG: Bifunctional NAD(P)H-hydrate repair enzyme Nnr [Chlamydiia bacterium]|nr:Bifunctional NAD(P)H-hydrate repair enzyme Nnr [Chlamydiia bacterium]MCH9618376.1 Bifunctional NAD(P)H-hydrate repair enzyme Nnr [Chlamydiia bacterium]MCH9624093.1 Bifunctional NAD(P)H-hydrate repair enzyme Nnr [Chlamydiia bacterium]
MQCKGKKDFLLFTSGKNISPFGEIIVSATSMASYERQLMKKDPCLSEKFMDIAALGLCHVLENKVFTVHSFERVVLLVGKGNNGGDAYALGALLLQMGYEVIAFQIFAETTPLAEKKGEAFEKLGGERVLISCADQVEISHNDLVVDGLLGTGCKGKVLGILKEVMDLCNRSSAFVFSIDIPSGVDGDSGKVLGSAIYATMTGYLGALKIGHLLEQGYDHVGLLHYVDFGMETDGIASYCFLANDSYVLDRLPKKSKKVHKYEAGELSVIAGTEEMSGAAELSCSAAYRTGAGLVRHFYLGSASCSIKEVISKGLKVESLEKDCARSKALLIGPGLGRGATAKEVVDKVMSMRELPIVIDGDALFLMDHPPEDAILTPHKGELINLLGVAKEIESEKLLEMAQRYCDDNNVIIVYKGMPTMILSPRSEKLCLVAGNPGMATAGSGDVLAGIIASFLAQGCAPLDASLLGVTVHGKAGDLAAEKLSPRFMVASDIIESLSPFFLSLDI